MDTLPMDCLSKILSLTSPVKVARSSVISKGFKSAANSDIVGEAFLPDDLQDFISRADSSLVYANNKELYFNLCHSPLILDGGKMSFSLEKRNGRKCFLVAAEELAWGHSTCLWEWTSNPNSRFSKVAWVLNLCWLDIHGKILAHKLSPRTYYAACLVFQFGGSFYGLLSAVADADRRASILRQSEKVLRRRDDGWLEVEIETFYIDQEDDGDVEIGTFYFDQEDDGEVEASLMEIARVLGPSGFIVEGIEFRPL